MTSIKVSDVLFFSLQRTSLQRMTEMKRVKKRKSAPVLNEICEEQELEEETPDPSFYRTNLHLSGRHSISTSSPTAQLHRTGPMGDARDPQPGKSPLFGTRTGNCCGVGVVLRLPLLPSLFIHVGSTVCQSLTSR